MVSTLLEIEPSVQNEVVVPIIWGNPGAFTFWNVTAITNFSAAMNQTIDAYFVQCSLSTNSTTVVIDIQTNALENPMPVPQLSTQWEQPLQWTSTDWSQSVRETPSISSGYQSPTIRFLHQIGYIISVAGGSGYTFRDGTGYTSEPSIVDEFRPYFHYHATSMPYLWSFILGI
jgi:hypothetical protein